MGRMKKFANYGPKEKIGSSNVKTTNIPTGQTKSMETGGQAFLLASLRWMSTLSLMSNEPHLGFMG
jgi:hypothetical protein